MRMLYGRTNRNLPSRFLKEIPLELCNSFGVSVRTYNVTQPSSSFTPTSANKSSFINKPQKAQSSGAYSVGMTVKHNTFGEGLILKTTPMGNDTLLEIAFSQVGTKKIMAGFAKLTII